MTDDSQGERPRRAAAGAAGDGSIVVGVDGSTGSRAALEYAFDEAMRRDLPVVAVTAFEPAIIWEPHGSVVSAATQQRRLRRTMSAVLEEVAIGRRDRGAPIPPTRLVIRSGPAGVVLENLAARAELLVVGHRGRGAPSSRILGSVGLNCVFHAACPVTVVPEPTAAQDLRAEAVDRSAADLVSR